MDQIRRLLRSALHLDPSNTQLWEVLTYNTYVQSSQHANAHDSLMLVCQLWTFLMSTASPVKTSNASHALSIKELSEILFTASTTNNHLAIARAAAIARNFDQATSAYKAALVEVPSEQGYRIWRELGCVYTLSGKVQTAEYAFGSSNRLLESVEQSQSQFEMALNHLFCAIAYHHSTQANKAKVGCSF